MIAKLNSSGSTQPGAWIVINNQKDKSLPSDRGRKSIKNGKVYLNDKEEFEIELYNPLKSCVLCDLKLNGQSISKTGLILRPGERFYLDCFIDDKKKFIFSTYEVENTNESEAAIQNNGLLEVFFYKEEVVTINDWQRRFDKVIVEKYYPVYYPVYYPTYYPYYPNRIWYGTTGTGISTTLNTNIGTYLDTSISNNVTYGLANTTSNSVVGTTFNSSLNSYNVSYTSNTSLNNSIETGRVEKGSSSSQKFTEVDMDFESNYITSVIIQILPNSRKPIETKEIKKQDDVVSNFCHSCGEKNSNYNFCPKCGRKLK